MVGKQIRQIKVGENSRYSSQLPEGFTDFQNSFVKDTGHSQLITAQVSVTDIKVHGKFMYWTFSNGWYLFSTFGMSGQWSPKPGKHICLEMQFIDPNDDYPFSAERIYFNDPRHFGTIKFTNNKQDLTNKLNELGWDPLQASLDKNIDWVSRRLKSTNKPIAEVLMDQGIFAGVGNYIRAEALYLSKLSPWRPSNQLTKEEVRSLCESIVTVMQESYQHQGATIHTYKTAYGEEGKYSTLFKVYSQKQDPLGNKIVTQQTSDKRTIHWCPAIQV